ncbi:unnamed protein product [Closterium sp. Yama58-4]|nr:unnamed protein product [Closterium sp. Yama58-4]
MIVEDATTIEDLWHIKKKLLVRWLDQTGTKGKLSVTSTRDALIRAVCGDLAGIEYKTCDVGEASYKHPDLRRVVVRMDGSATGSDHSVAATAATAVDAPTDAPTTAVDAPTAAPTATVDAPRATADETDTDVDGEWIIFQDVAEMFAWDPHPVHGIRPSSYASLLLVQEVAGRSDTVGASFDFGADMTEQEEVAATQAEIQEVRDRGWWDNAGESRGPSGNDPMGGAIQTGVTAIEGERRWVRKAKRTRRNQRSRQPSAEGGDGPSDDMAVVEEVSFPQRFSIHFHHVMVRGATLAKEGRTMTAEDVEAELALSAEHWAGDHSRCARHGIVPRCVADGWGPKSAVYEYGGTTHLAFRSWLRKHYSAEKMQPFVLGASSWLNESFHSVICKYAPKRVHFRGSMEARIALSILHWNNTVERLVLRHIIRIRRATRVRRGKKDRVLGPMNWQWTQDIFAEWRRASSLPC